MTLGVIGDGNGGWNGSWGMEVEVANRLMAAEGKMRCWERWR